jgi:hypothetical protein
MRPREKLISARMGTEALAEELQDINLACSPDGLEAVGGGAPDCPAKPATAMG